MFKSASERAYLEAQGRLELSKQTPLSFGVEFLDDALEGIFPDDLILIGAGSGAGKTQLCCNIVRENILKGKTVHYIALEASSDEIERRLKYPIVLNKFLSDPVRPQVEVTFPKWLRGKLYDQLREYEDKASQEFESVYRNLHLLYKSEKFGITELIESVCYCAHRTDLILIDHVHYFDYEDDNENRAVKEIAKTVRNLALNHQKPIVLVAHLRKRDKYNNDLVPGLEEFHGSSDLYKIATKVVTLAAGQLRQDGRGYDTYFRIPKNRIDGGVTRFLAREIFSPKRGGYEKNSYDLSWAGQSQSEGFAILDGSNYPTWAKRRRPDALVGGYNPNTPWKS